MAWKTPCVCICINWQALNTESRIWHSNILGTGKDLVILHGFLGMGDNWISLARRWAAGGFRVHLPDLRNHGQSFWDERFDFEVLLDDLRRYIGHHQLHKPHIIGHSLGGKLAMFDALDEPGNRGKYVVLDIASRAYGRRHDFIFRAVRQTSPGQCRTRNEVEAQLMPHLPQAHIRRFVMKNLKRLPGGGFAWKIPWDILEKSVENIGRALPHGKSSNANILFLRGENSDFVLDDDIAQIKQIFPRAQIHPIPGAGHWLHAEQPEMVYRIITDFLNA